MNKEEFQKIAMEIRGGSGVSSTPSFDSAQPLDQTRFQEIAQSIKGGISEPVKKFSSAGSQFVQETAPSLIKQGVQFVEEKGGEAMGRIAESNNPFQAVKELGGIAKWFAQGLGAFGVGVVQSVREKGLEAEVARENAVRQAMGKPLLTEADLRARTEDLRTSFENNEILKKITGGNVDSYQEINESIQGYLDKNPNSTAFEKKFGAPILVAGLMLSDFYTGGRGKAVSKSIFENVSTLQDKTPSTVGAILKRNNIPDNMIDEATPRIIAAQSDVEVENILKEIVSNKAKNIATEADINTVARNVETDDALAKLNEIGGDPYEASKFYKSADDFSEAMMARLKEEAVSTEAMDDLKKILDDTWFKANMTKISEDAAKSFKTADDLLVKSGIDQSDMNDYTLEQVPTKSLREVPPEQIDPKVVKQIEKSVKDGKPTIAIVVDKDGNILNGAEALTVYRGFGMENVPVLVRRGENNLNAPRLLNAEQYYGKPHEVKAVPSHNVLPKEVSVSQEARAVGAKRIAPDRVPHQQLTPQEGIEALVEDKKKQAERNAKSWEKAVEDIDKIIAKYGNELPRRTDENIKKYPDLVDDIYKVASLKKYAPGARTLKDMRESFKRSAERVGWTKEKEEAYRKIVYTEYKNLIKKDISKGYKYPDAVLDYDESFRKAVDSRARYEKGLATSFSADDTRIVFDESGIVGAGMKRQDGNPITQEQISEIRDGVKDVSDILGIDMKRLAEENRWVYVHLNEKNPFLRKNTAGLYREGEDGNISISLGGKEAFEKIVDGKVVKEFVNTVISHEIGHALDFYTKNKLFDNGFLFDRRRDFNPVTYSTRSNKYWRSPEEVTARMIEQYIAVKKGNENIYSRPGYWTKEIFDSKIAPAIEESIGKNFSDYRKTIEVKEPKEIGTEKEATTPKTASAFIEEKGLDPLSVMIKDEEKFILEDTSGNDAILTELPLSIFGEPKFETAGKYKAGRKITDPIEVTLVDGEYNITEGANRFTQAKANKDKTIPVALSIQKNGDMLSGDELIDEFNKTKKEEPEPIPEENIPSEIKAEEGAVPEEQALADLSDAQLYQEERLSDLYEDYAKHAEDVEKFKSLSDEVAFQIASKPMMEKVSALEDLLKKEYKLSGEEAERHFSELWTTLDEARPGYRKMDPETREWSGVPSTFPSWIPEGMRSKKFFDSILQDMKDVDSIQFPVGRSMKQREFVNAMLDQLDSRLDIDTSARRKEIMDLYRNNTKKAIEEAKKLQKQAEAEARKERKEQRALAKTEKQKAQYVKDIHDDILEKLTRKRFGYAQMAKAKEAAKTRGEAIGKVLGRKEARTKELEKRKELISKTKEKIKTIRAEELEKRQEIRTKGKEEMKKIIGQTRDRKKQVRAIADHFALTDAELNSLIRNKNIATMDTKMFNDMLDEFYIRAEQTKELSDARAQLQGTIFEKELKKWENVREAMKLPPLKDMSAQDMRKLDEVLSQYKTGDEFLTKRDLETIDRTDFSGMRTVREVEDYFRNKGVKKDELGELKPHPWMYDTQLKRMGPFYSMLVDSWNKSYLTGTERALKVIGESNELIKKARASRARSLSDRLVPTDKQIVNWLESDKEGRAKLEKDMTPEEIKAAEYMDRYYRSIYDWMVKREIEKKFTSRFEDTYYHHTKRGMLEAWKDEGFVKGLRESIEEFKQEERTMKILDQKTGEILPYQKWLGSQQFRTGSLSPTKNAALAFRKYVQNIEKARQLDEFIPQIMIAVHALSPRLTTKEGLMMDDTLQTFVKKWINSKKGRTEKVALTPGSAPEWALRTAVTMLRLRDLGFNLTTQAASVVGEQAGNIIMLRQKYPLGTARLLTKQGRNIVDKYKNFVGESIYERLSDPSTDVGDKLMTGMMGGFAEASRLANKQFLLGMLTPDEFKKGEISPERLAFLRDKMGRYRVVEDAESIIGKSAEMGAIKQHKKWSIPMIVTTASNLKTLAQNVKKDGVKALKSEEGAELLTASLMTATVGLGAGAYYQSLEDKGKERNVIEDLTYKAIRESLSLIGALDPRYIAKFTQPRLASFLMDLSDALMDVATLKEYKQSGKGFEEGDLVGVQKLQKILTPTVVSQFLPEAMTPAEEELKKLKKMTKDEANARYEEIKKENPNLATQIKNLKKDEDLGITDEDRKIRAMNVKDKERAEYIYEKLKDFDTREEKNAYVQELQDKKILTKEVKDQLREMIKADQE